MGSLAADRTSLTATGGYATHLQLAGKHRLLATRGLFTGFLLALSVSVWAKVDSQAPVQNRSQQYNEQPAKGSNEKAAKNDGASKLLPALVAQAISKPENEKSEANGAAEHDWYDTFLDHPTELLLVLFSGLLVLYTARLWDATSKLVEGAADTAKRQLRAYVALKTIEHDPAVVTGTDRGIKIRVENYGATTAHHVSIIQTCFEEAQPDTYRHPPTTKADKLANQMLHPRQAFNHFVPSSKGTECVDRVIDVCLHQFRPFYVYGRIDYMDIYKRWWTTFFCEQYDPGKPEGKRCTPHHHHNYEYPGP